MEFLRYVRNDVIKTNSTVTKYESFDTQGLMARFKVTNGTIYIHAAAGKLGQNKESYPVETGEIFEFVGCIQFYGNATVEYILFDRV